MTKEEFIAGYCQRSSISWDELGKYLVAMPCACGNEGCSGWAMVHNDDESIRHHLILYSPAEVTPNGKDQAR